MARWTQANLLSSTPEARHLWQFTPKGSELPPLNRDLKFTPDQKLPAEMVAKDWQSLLQPKLNIAWLPPERIYIRALLLPVAEYAEVVSMVEFQLERISPLPVAQIAWTMEILPQKLDGQQSVVVIVVPRSLVEEFVGQLEGKGFIPDRLDFPLLDQLLATQPKNDGVWLYPGATTADPTLIAWWYGGILRQATLLSWSGQADAEQLRTQLSQMAWAGELEGWLTTPPRWHIITDSSQAAVWEALLRPWLTDESIESIAPPPLAQLAATSARRNLLAHPAAPVLLPAEYAKRFRQQFIDKLWMRGLMGVIVLYLAGVAIYFGALMMMQYQVQKLEAQVAGLSQNYTNAVDLRQRVSILEEQASLKFCALDCWKMLSDLLPQELALNSFNFQRGKTITLTGTVSPDNASKLVDYYEAVGRAPLNGNRPILRPLSTPPARNGPSGVQLIYWSFSLDLASNNGGAK